MAWNPAGSLKGPKGDPGAQGPSSWAGGVTSLGSGSGTIPINLANGPEQEAVMSGDTTVGAPAAGADGQKVLLIFRSSGASRVLTIGSALGLIAGMPRSRQVPVGSQAWVLLRYSVALTRWTVIAFPQEG